MLSGRQRELAQSPDTVLLNGKVVRFGAAPAGARGARRQDRGARRIGDVRALAGPATRIVDLGGRTVIPGLINSHIHAIRAGLTFTSEVHWIGVRVARRGARPHPRGRQDGPKGGWLVVAGGWTERQFAEGRLPTQGEITAAAPDHHVYVQLAYSRVLLSRGGVDAIGLAQHAALAPRLTVERDSAGARPAGSPATTARSAGCSTCCRRRASPRRSKARARSSARSTASASPA